MEITSAEFVVSNSRADMCPQTNLPEYAFIGRSNVGKSSLINMLTKQPKLAMTSATPGKTLLINHFLVNKEWYLVDLPGYGYAQRGKKMMDKIQKLIEYYVLEREQMTCLFVLVDSRLSLRKSIWNLWSGWVKTVYLLLSFLLNPTNKAVAKPNSMSTDIWRF